MTKRRLLMVILASLILVAQNLFGAEINGKRNDESENPIKLSINENNLKFKIGEKLSLELIFKNVSMNVQKISYFRPTFWYPQFKSAETGEPLEVSGELYNGPAMRVVKEIQPQESISISSSPVHLIKSENQTNEGKLICRQGNYQIYFKIPLAINDKKAILTSNTINISIIE